jgi:hypothetical protein
MCVCERERGDRKRRMRIKRGRKIGKGTRKRKTNIEREI